MHARPPLALLLATPLLAGCSQTKLLRAATADRINCSPDAITLSDIQRSGTRPRVWRAGCAGQEWICTNTAYGHITCEAQAPRPASTINAGTDDSI